MGGNRDILSESRPAYLTLSKLLQAASPMALPPWAVESGENPASIDLELVLFADDAGAHVLDIDFVYLLPLEYWRYYRMTASYLAEFVVNDNPHSGTVKSHLAMVGHQAEGPGVWVYPGKAQRFYFVAEATSLTPHSHSATVLMYYRPRRAEL